MKDEEQNLNKAENGNSDKADVSSSFSPTLDDVVGRMANWKMNSALNYAKKVENFPAKALIILEQMAEKFGNCGWQDGSIYNELQEAIDKVIDLIGYEYNEAEGWWLKKN